MRTRHFYTHHFEVGEKEVAVTFEFNYYPGHPGSMYRRNGDPGDPPEPADIDVLSYARNDGEKIDESFDEVIQKWLSSDDSWEKMGEATEIDYDDYAEDFFDD